MKTNSKIPKKSCKIKIAMANCAVFSFIIPRSSKNFPTIAELVENNIIPTITENKNENPQSGKRKKQFPPRLNKIQKKRPKKKPRQNKPKQGKRIALCVCRIGF